jgi:heme/copper-type cytochrome/quinol oxidase subunit 2
MAAAGHPGEVGGADMTGRAGKTRNIWLVWLVWPLITLGVYYFVWWYKINREARDFDEKIEVNPVLSLLAVTIGSIIIVPPFVSIYRTGLRIAKMQEDAELQPSCNGWIGVGLSFVASLQSLYYQTELNKLWAQLGSPEEGALVALPAAARPETTGPTTTPVTPATGTAPQS